MFKGLTIPEYISWAIIFVGGMYTVGYSTF